MVPSNNRRVICEVITQTFLKKISHKIIESAMGYRGSKSVTDLKMAVHQIKSVKEQRVDGSWYFKDFGPTNSRTNWSKGLAPSARDQVEWEGANIYILDTTISQKYLRCTLMGFEISYQTRILSNLINRSYLRYYSSKPVQQCEKHNLIMELASSYIFF